MKYIINRSLISIFLLTVSLFSCKTFDYGKKSVPVENYWGICHFPLSYEKDDFRIISEMGIKWIRIDLSWDQIEMAPNEYDFSRYDTFIEEALSHNLEIIAVLNYVNPIYTATKKRAIPRDIIKNYVDYILACAEHYSGKVNVFELWNEPNVHFWQGSDKDFFHLQKTASHALKEYNRKIILLNGGIFWGDAAYLAKMFKSGALQNIDIINYHPYAVNPQRSYVQMKKMKKTARKYGFKGELWITEMGYPIGGLYPSRIKDSKMFDYIVKTFCYSLAAGNSCLTWYRFADDQPPSPFDSEQYFGVVNRDRSSRKASETITLLNKELKGSIYSPGLLSIEKGILKNIRAFPFTNGKEIIVILWSRNGRVECTINESHISAVRTPQMIRIPLAESVEIRISTDSYY